ncbi:MAG: glycosyltransferase [Candidatus Dojkabacteria bacterium]|nr:glycosyltransferase [Candidatus Dojkabacteria bacterium]
MNYSIIVTAWKEPETVKKAINSVLNPEWNNLSKNSDFEIIVACPDEETWKSALSIAQEFKFENIIWVKDPQKGKPTGLNMALEKVRGQIIILTDGDVYMDKEAVPALLEHFKDSKVGGVTGRPVALGKKNNFMQFAAHFYADVAHHKRMVTMRKDVAGKSLKIVSKEPGFFVLSGYLSAMRKGLVEKIPGDCLIDDAYISYVIHNKGYKLAYEPESKVFVKYAQDLKDWYAQKLRSVGGYEQLWKYGVIKKETKVRNFWKELEYALWYPITYVKHVKEVFWALLLYPTRLWLWIQIFWQQRIKKKSFSDTWVRIESTK